ncbi:MAG: hypothetical protein JRJ13_00635 [Deltaproteobacteria bacterium]|nr:hypothetical protein [Deltaproteobacteria bacterium]MBW2025596.1 hypothetical protein [Deltaproteobacteria bacterium]
MLLQGFSFVSSGRFKEAEPLLRKVVSYSNEYGAEIIGTPAQALLGIVTLASGNIRDGVRILQEVIAISKANERQYVAAIFEYILGKVYLEMSIERKIERVRLSVRNVVFLLSNFLRASKKAENYFTDAMDLANQIGAKLLAGQIGADLGLFYHRTGKEEKAKAYIIESIKLLERCGTNAYLEEAKRMYQSIAIK